MAYTAPPFQSPPFLKPVDYSGIPAGVDALFSSYASQREIEMQQQQINIAKQGAARASGQAMLQYGVDPAQVAKLSPEELQSAINPPAQTSGPGGQPSGQPAQEPPIYGQIRAVHQAMLAGAAAAVAKTQGEAGKLASEADVNAIFTGKSYGPGGQPPAQSPQQQRPGIEVPDQEGYQLPATLRNSGLANWAYGLRQDVKAGRLAPDQAMQEMSRMGPQGLGKVLGDQVLQGLPMGSLQAAQSGKVAAANTAESSAIKIPQYGANALLKSLDVLDSIQKSIPRSEFQPLANLTVKAALATGNRKFNRLVTQVKTAAEQYQNVYGGGSDSKLALAADVLDPTKTVGQLMDSIAILRADTQNKVGAYRGSQSTALPDFGDGPQAVPTITDANGYSGLSSGSHYKGPDGVTRVKK